MLETQVSYFYFSGNFQFSLYFKKKKKKAGKNTNKITKKKKKKAGKNNNKITKKNN